MAWDETEPGPTTKLRNLSELLTGNFKAIERGDEADGTILNQRSIQLADRSTVASSLDPTAVTGTLFVYNKQDAVSSDEELFVVRPTDTGDPYQITNGAQLVPASNNAETSNFIPGGLIIKTGRKSITTFDGDTTITFATAFPNQIYSVVAATITPNKTTGNLGSIKANSSVSLFLWKNFTNSTYSIYWVAYGS